MLNDNFNVVGKIYVCGHREGIRFFGNEGEKMSGARIGLIDVDSHNFPNLCLMKLSAWHKKQGDHVEWWNGFTHYDRVYMSKVFTEEYTPDMNFAIQADEIIRGGTGYGIKNVLPEEVEHSFPDYSLYPKWNASLGHLTRGCPRSCPFCIVSEKEGRQSIQVAELSEFHRPGQKITLLDPNLLACQNHEKLLKQLAETGDWVDFTQGLDARCITRDNARLLAKIKIKMMHFAFDNIEQEQEILRGLRIFKEISGIDERKASVYVLTNFNTDHRQDLYRIHLIQEAGYRPYIMIYNKPSAPKKTRDLQRWCNNRIIYFATGRNFSIYQKEGDRNGSLYIRE